MRQTLYSLLVCLALSALSPLVAGSYEQALMKSAERQLTTRRSHWTRGDIFAILDKPMDSPAERRAMRFLYAYMPLSDMTDYTLASDPGTYYLRGVRSTLRAKAEMPWGVRVPEREWYHFVLPMRVNNEALDEARTVLYDQLRDRVKTLTMGEAVLEVNRWCHEHVTYAPSDSRTSAPLSTIRSAYGRCGEESTLLVSALRAVGIPARQVYTPRWAHTDDNHAWVEAWVDGRWRFLGACEPEAVLDLGWFNAPASRAMLVHTRVFGAYQGAEPIIRRNDCVTEINVTAGYAPASYTRVQVVDVEGRPVRGAQVDFKLYNYAEFYTVGHETSDAEGMARFLAGHGDMLVWASGQTNDGLRVGFAKASFGQDSLIRVVLGYGLQDAIDIELDITPPVESPRYPAVTESERAYNLTRLAYGDSVRNAYVASFVDRQLPRLDARGNWAEIRHFVEESADRERALGLLRVISAKDLRDARAEVLRSHLEHTRPAHDYRDTAMVWQYIYSPRVSTETMTPYREQLRSEVPTALLVQWSRDPELFVRWCQSHILRDQRVNPLNVPMSPLAVWRTRMADPHSLDIFFVALMRTLGYPARIHEVTGKAQYYSHDEVSWVDVSLSSTPRGGAVAPTGILRLGYEGNGIVDNPTYYTHFTLSRITDDGALQLQSYDLEDKGLEQGATWMGTFRDGVSVEAGQYLLVTGSRMASGNVLARLSSVRVEPGETTDATIVMRRDSTQIAVIGGFDAELQYMHLGTVGTLATQSALRAVEGERRSILSTTGRGYYILGIIGAQQEPSNHALRDLATLNDILEAWGRPMLLLYADDTHRYRYQPSEFPALGKQIHLGVDTEGKVRQALIQAFKLSDQELPIFIIADTFNRVVYIKQGYTIGLGEQLKAIIAGLRDGKLSPSGACTLP